MLLIMGSAALFGVNSADAFSSRATTITSYCTSNGYTLLPEFQADTCDAACHNNAAGSTAFNNGNYEYFCPPPTNTCTDADNDGYFVEGAACGTAADFNDNNSAAYPGATEVCTDGVDNDGNGLVDANDPNAVGCTGNCLDADGDGYSVDGGSCGPIDCDDNNSSVNPGAAEACNDGIDNNCNGLIDTVDPNAIGCPSNCVDQDGDGYSSSGGACGPIDCNDNDASVNPGVREICSDGSDNNCNSQIDSSDSVCQGGGGDNGGGDNGGGNDNFRHPLGWTNPISAHQDYLDDNGVEQCLSCHSIDRADIGSATSCYNCHGQEWDDPSSGSGNNDDDDDDDDKKSSRDKEREDSRDKRSRDGSRDD